MPYYYKKNIELSKNIEKLEVWSYLSVHVFHSQFDDLSSINIFHANKKANTRYFKIFLIIEYLLYMIWGSLRSQIRVFRSALAVKFCKIAHSSQ